MRRIDIKTKVAFFLLTIAAFCACTKLAIEKDTPKCIKQEIVDFNRSEGCNNAKVSEYTFQGQTVYLFSPGNCGADMQSPVLDADCNRLGALGGYVGNSQINGESFSHAVYVRTVWPK